MVEIICDDDGGSDEGTLLKPEEVAVWIQVLVWMV
jgi:hypothetical protein